MSFTSFAATATGVQMGVVDEPMFGASTSVVILAVALILIALGNSGGKGRR